MIRCENCGKCM